MTLDEQAHDSRTPQEREAVEAHMVAYDERKLYMSPAGHFLAGFRAGQVDARQPPAQSQPLERMTDDDKQSPERFAEYQASLPAEDKAELLRKELAMVKKIAAAELGQPLEPRKLTDEQRERFEAAMLAMAGGRLVGQQLDDRKAIIDEIERLLEGQSIAAPADARAIRVAGWVDNNLRRLLALHRGGGSMGYGTFYESVAKQLQLLDAAIDAARGQP